ncbi:MAG TPA: response regulator [Oligoflexus sp.]|uniref:response regulator n=1 Tax=Oligoflexus sp. TaxID=1971216 RepID=UPI002D74BFD3|nr:response regulator [Oligoflexus sp.]HYX36631.1 response regulator [Oligoflexus sp.]
MNILLVDDEPSILEVLADMYEGHFSDISITQCSNGALALHECWQKKFDLICTDYRMPVLDGLEFTEIVRHREGPNQKTAILFLSGYVPEFKFKAEVHDNVFFIEKPVHPDRLMRISAIAAKHSLNPKVG